MKTFLKFLLALILLFVVVILINTIRFKSKQLSVIGERRIVEIDTAAVRHLSEAIRIRTISYDDNNLIDYTQFDSLYSFLEKTYPLTFQKLSHQRINDYSLLFHWKSSSDKLPIILYAHLDVVPVDSTTLAIWKYEPFAGATDKLFIYGRGTIDDKGSVIAILESIENLLKNNFTPSRDIYLAFGHDEEATGINGAKEIAEQLLNEGVKAEFLLDEGGLIAVDMVPFVMPPVAMIATSEKGYMSVELSVKGSGGHSSFPPENPPIEILANAIKKIHDNPFERKSSESLNDFMEYAGPEMKLPFRAIFANRWLFRPIVFDEYEKIPSANAMIRTTSVATMIHGGVKENVVPSDVSAIINFRLLPGDNSYDVIEQVMQVINDVNVQVSIKGPVSEASNVSSVKSEGFILLQKTIKNVFPDVIVTPSLLIGQTDSRHFRKVTKNIFRFLPVRMDNGILDSMHGMDEKIGVKEFSESVVFYRELIKSL